MKFRYIMLVIVKLKSIFDLKLLIPQLLLNILS